LIHTLRIIGFTPGFLERRRGFKQVKYMSEKKIEKEESYVRLNQLGGSAALAEPPAKGGVRPYVGVD
jgi:hypothetical protein